ncbi:unnamed protein product [Allacma fusca]|uniref:Mediator of RNA polymerase II transcription subunit 15 n=1 Tax=Allacma fusca TaxID=39272 RepID=A0A8J2JWT9_9HEXA|nr:unnamed protein product [Allacma fusca]
MAQHALKIRIKGPESEPGKYPYSIIHKSPVNKGAEISRDLTQEKHKRTRQITSNMEQPDLSTDTHLLGWQTDMSSQFRDGMTDKIEQAMSEYGSSLPSTAREMESRVFSRASSKAEYMDFMGRMIIHLNIVGSNHDSPIMPHPTRIEEIQEG